MRPRRWSAGRSARRQGPGSQPSGQGGAAGHGPAGSRPGACSRRRAPGSAVLSGGEDDGGGSGGVVRRSRWWVRSARRSMLTVTSSASRRGSVRIMDPSRWPLPGMPVGRLKGRFAVRRDHVHSAHALNGRVMSVLLVLSERTPAGQRRPTGRGVTLRPGSAGSLDQERERLRAARTVECPQNNTNEGDQQRGQSGERRCPRPNAATGRQRRTQPRRHPVRAVSRARVPALSAPSRKKAAHGVAGASRARPGRRSASHRERCPA